MLDDKSLANWREFLAELDSLLKSEKLLPLIRDWPNWSGGVGSGVNVRRVFTEPRDFDLILWIQGSAAVPYLENGQLSGQLWHKLINAILSGKFREFGVLPL